MCSKVSNTIDRVGAGPWMVVDAMELFVLVTDGGGGKAGSTGLSCSAEQKQVWSVGGSIVYFFRCQGTDSYVNAAVQLQVLANS